MRHHCGVRVVAGILKGRRLVAPKGTATRPTSDRVREAIFSMVGSRVDLEGARVADLFAGSGAMGIEALSRGATEALFLDSGAAAVQAIESNLSTTGLAGRVIRGDVLGYLRTNPEHFDAAFVDPPYAWEGWAELFECLDAGLVVAESDQPLEPGGQWRVLKVARYGDTVVTLAQHAGAC